MKHGYSGYTTGGCRCPICTKEHTDYMRVYLKEWRKKNPHYKRDKQRQYRAEGRDSWLNRMGWGKKK